MTPNYGSDLSCTTDLDPMLRLVSGQEMMAQVCLRRLYCRRGNLLSNPNDNTLDARDFIGEGLQLKDLPRVAGQCQAALLGDSRIAQVSVVGTFDLKKQILTLSISGTGSQGPFALVLKVSSLTVELLRPS